MAEQRESERHLAMLIDADNAQHSLLKQMIEATSRHGTITICRAYGDWTKQNLSKWRSAMLEHVVEPIQQWRYAAGKNATDGRLIIDAMDILHTENVHGFCIVSSDSDFTVLCMRIQKSGLFVMGMGRKQTPEAFVKACNVFVHVENLTQSKKTAQPKQAAQSKKAEPKQAAQPKKPAQPKKVEPNKVGSNGADLMNLLRRAFDILEPDDGWALLSALGDALHRLDPSFDSRTYDHNTLSLLIKSLPQQFVVKSAKKTGPSAIYVRLKDS
jgi:uncharacterized LabA/DUF88 family protein